VLWQSETSMRKIEKYLSVAVITALLAFFIVGCGKDDTQAEDNELVVLCGSSFPNPMSELCSQFTEQTGIRFATTVAGSESHLPLIKTAHMGDIFVTHDPYLDYVRDANCLLDYVQVGYVSGEMVFALLEKKGIKEAVMKNVENRLTKGHSDLGTFLKTKTVDAVIMWNGVAYTFRDSLDVVPTPYEYDEEIRVHIMGLNYSRKPDLLRKFLEFAKNKGKAVFARHGYVK